MPNLSAFNTSVFLRRLVFLAVFVLLPLTLNGYYLFQVTSIFILSVALLGLNLLVGLNGQVSLGHGAFMGLGAYAMAIVTHHFGWNYGFGLAVAGVLTYTVGLLFGYPALRLDKHSMPAGTVALAIAFSELLLRFDSLTGGAPGLSVPSGAPPDLPLLRGLTKDEWIYYLTLFLLVIVFLFFKRVVPARPGRALIAVRDNPTAALSMGVDLRRTKTTTFAVSALFCGMAGALWALLIGHVAPHGFSYLLSINLIIGVLVGGSTSVLGALCGAVFIHLVPNLTESISKTLTAAIFGGTVLIILYLCPDGLASRIFKNRLRAGGKIQPS